MRMIESQKVEDEKILRKENYTPPASDKLLKRRKILSGSWQLSKVISQCALRCPGILTFFVITDVLVRVEVLFIFFLRVFLV
jgi:hypothetical protein